MLYRTDNLLLTSVLVPQMELDVAGKLFGYGRLLRKVAANNLFDYSAAQATSNWIAESIQGCSTDFLPLQGPARGLRDAMSLSSGLGITEIWSTLSVQRSYHPSLTELRSLENTACNLDSACDIHGVFVHIRVLCSSLKSHI
jgi:midasin